MSGNQERREVDERGREVVEERSGCAYVSSNGQLVIDQHASDEEHLRSSQTRESQPLYDCRLYLNDVIPKEWLGRRGKFTVRRVTSVGGEVLEVSVAFERGDYDATRGKLGGG